MIHRFIVVLDKISTRSKIREALNIDVGMQSKNVGFQVPRPAIMYSSFKRRCEDVICTAASLVAELNQDPLEK